MSIATPFQGSLFANDFLRDAVARLDDWRELDADALDASARNIFNRFPMKARPKTI